MGGEAGGVGDVSPGSLDLDSKKIMGTGNGGWAKKSKWKMVGGGREAAASQANHEKKKINKKE